MTVLSPLKYRLSSLKEALFGEEEIIYEKLICYQQKLPKSTVQVSWERDGEFIVGSIFIEGEKYMTQAHSAQEFVEMVNDAIYAIFEIPSKYTKHLGGNYRLMPPEEEFGKLNNAAIKKSSLDFKKSIALA